MIYTCQNQDKNMDFVISCNCGCGNSFEFKVIDDSIFISALESSFYAKQNIIAVAQERISKFAKALTHKDNGSHEVMLSTEDLFRLRDCLNRINLSELKDESSKYDNCSNLVIDVVDAECGIFALLISPKEGHPDFLHGKNYRQYELVWNETELRRFKAYVQSVISQL